MLQRPFSSAPGASKTDVSAMRGRHFRPHFEGRQRVRSRPGARFPSVVAQAMPHPFAPRFGDWVRSPSRGRTARVADTPVPGRALERAPVLGRERPDLETERLLVVRAQSGDKAAVGELLKKHGPTLYRV